MHGLVQLGDLGGFSLPGEMRRARARPRAMMLVGRLGARCRRTWWPGTAAACGRRSGRAARPGPRADTSVRPSAAAVGQPDLDLERVAAVDGRRAGGGGVELARHHLVQPLEDQLLADRRDAIGGRGADLASPGSPGTARRPRAGRSCACWPGCSAWPSSQIRRATRRADPRKRRRSRNCDERRRPWSSLSMRHQHPQLDAVGMRLDLLAAPAAASRSRAGSPCSLPSGSR